MPTFPILRSTQQKKIPDPSKFTSSKMELVILHTHKERAKDHADRLSINSVHVDKHDTRVVYYHAYICSLKVENNSDSDSTGISVCYKFLLFCFIVCPVIWFIVTGFINLYEAIVWKFTYPTLLWVVYSIATISVVVDFAINIRIISILKNKCILNNMLGDFLLIFVLVSGFLVPMMIKSSMEPDDEFNTTDAQMSANLVDGFVIIAMTVGNVVLNRLTENNIQCSILNKTVYFDQVNTVLADSDADNDNANMKNAKSAIREAVTMMKKHVKVDFLDGIDGLHKESVLRIGEILDRTLEEMDRKNEPTGKFRFVMRLKMITNLLSTVLFLFYSGIYLSASNGCYVFVLFLSVLSFLNNTTSASCIRAHDTAASKMYTLNGFEIRLGIGQYNGFEHVQFYLTLLTSLVNLVFRISVTRA